MAPPASRPPAPRQQRHSPGRALWVPLALRLSVLASITSPAAPYRAEGSAALAALPSFAISGAGADVSLHGLNFAPGGTDRGRRAHRGGGGDGDPVARDAALCRFDAREPHPLEYRADAIAALCRVAPSAGHPRRARLVGFAGVAVSDNGGADWTSGFGEFAVVHFAVPPTTLRALAPVAPAGLPAFFAGEHLGDGGNAAYGCAFDGAPSDAGVGVVVSSALAACEMPTGARDRRPEGTVAREPFVGRVEILPLGDAFADRRASGAAVSAGVAARGWSEAATASRAAAPTRDAGAETAGARRRGGSAGGDVFVATFCETGASFVGVGCLFGTVRVDARGGPAAAENAEGAEGAAEAVACVAPATRPNANLRLAVGSRFAETRAGSIDVFLSADSRSGSWGPFSAAGSAAGPLALVAGREGGDALAFAAGPRGFGGVALACVGRTAAGAPMAPALGTTDGGSGGLLEGGLGLGGPTEGALLRCAAPAYPAGAGGFRAVSVVSVFSGDAAGGLHAHALTRARRVDGFVTVAVRAAPSVRDASPPAVAVADGFANPPTRVSGADFFPSDETSPFFCVSFGTRAPARVVSSALAICPGVESHAARRFVEATGAGASRLDVGWALDRLGGSDDPGFGAGSSRSAVALDADDASAPRDAAVEGLARAPEGLLAGVGLSRAPVVVALPSRGGAEVRVRLGSVDSASALAGYGCAFDGVGPVPARVVAATEAGDDALDLGAAFLACVSPAMAPSRATGSLPRLTLTRLRARATHEGLDLAARGPEAPVVVVVASGGSDEETRETFLETRGSNPAELGSLPASRTQRSNRPAVVALARFSPEALDAGGGTVATATASPESPGFFALGGSFGARCVFALGGSFPGAARITAVTDARVVSAAVATCEAPGVRSAAGGYSYAFGGSFVSGAASVATSRSRDDAFFEEEGVVSAPPSSFSSALFWRRAPTVRSVTPSRGPAAGGTAATVRGRGFADGRGSPSAWVGALGPVAGRAARLDDGAEAAEFVTPAAAPAVRPVAVSATRRDPSELSPDATFEHEAADGDYYHRGVFSPLGGVHSGSLDEEVYSFGGPPRSAAGRLNDVGAGPTTKRASPDVSPAAGGGVAWLAGANLHEAALGGLGCLVAGDARTKAVFVSSALVACELPPIPEGGLREVGLAATTREGTFPGTPPGGFPRVAFVDASVVISVRPSSVAASGGSAVTATLAGSPSGATPSIGCSFGAVGPTAARVVVAGDPNPLGGPSALVCVSPALGGSNARVPVAARSPSLGSVWGSGVWSGEPGTGGGHGPAAVLVVDDVARRAAAPRDADPSAAPSGSTIFEPFAFSFGGEKKMPPSSALGSLALAGLGTGSGSSSSDGFPGTVPVPPGFSVVAADVWGSSSRHSGPGVPVPPGTVPVAVEGVAAPVAAGVFPRVALRTGGTVVSVFGANLRGGGGTGGAAEDPAPVACAFQVSARPRSETSPVAYSDVPDPDATVSSAVLRCELPGAHFLELPGVASASEASISVERRRSLSPGGAGSGSVAGGVQILALVASPRVTSVIPGTLARDGGDETRAEGSGFSSGGTAEDALDEEKERSESGCGGSSSSHGGEGASCWFGSVGPVAARVGLSGGSATCASPALGGRRRATLRVLNGGLGSGAWDDSTPPFVLRVANACAERSEPIGTSVERGRGGGGHQRVTLAGWGFEDPRERSRDAFASDAFASDAASVASRATAPRLPLPWVFSCAFAGAPDAPRVTAGRGAGAIACAFGARGLPAPGFRVVALRREGAPGAFGSSVGAFSSRASSAAPATVAVRRAPSAFSAYPSKSPSDGGGVLWISGEDFDADEVRHACAFAGAGAATVSFSGSGLSSGSGSSSSGASSPFAASEATAMSSALVACEIPAAAGEGLPGAAPVAIFARGAFGEEGAGDLAPAAWLEYLPGGGGGARSSRDAASSSSGSGGSGGIVAPSRGPAGGGTPVRLQTRAGDAGGFALASGDRGGGCRFGAVAVAARGVVEGGELECVTPGRGHAQGRVEVAATPDWRTHSFRGSGESANFFRYVRF